MATSSVLVPIIVAVIGVIGAVVPAVYVNNLQLRPDLILEMNSFGGGRADFGYNSIKDNPEGYEFFSIHIHNYGDAPATNLSLLLEPETISSLHAQSRAKIFDIANRFSTTDVILPKYNDTILEPRNNKTINQPLLEILVPKLIHGTGSEIRLRTITSVSTGLKVSAVYDQGSDFLSTEASRVTTENPPLNFTKVTEDSIQQAGFYLSTLFTPGLVVYYLSFFSIFAGAIILYNKLRKRSHIFLNRILDNILEIRGKLNDDLMYSDPLSIPEGKWFSSSNKEKRHAIKDLHDFLLINDFYSEVENRNSHLPIYEKIEQSELSRANTLTRLNEAVLAAAEYVLNKVDWNKYR